MEVYDGEQLVTPTSPKLRHVLAALLLHANRPVRPESLIEELWLHEPPATAATTLQTYIYRLRKKLGLYEGIGEQEILATVNSSYLMRAKAEQLDMTLFEQLSRLGQDALQDGRPEQASSLLDEALSLWRGNMLEGVPVGPLLEAHVVRFEEARLRAHEMRIEAGLQLGRHHELIAELRSLISSHPLHEGFPAQLMLALYRSDRRLEALEVYRSLRRRLVTELGLDPSGELVALHRAILSADPSLNLPGGERKAVRLNSGPAQLPVREFDLAVHKGLAAQLEAVLRTAADRPRYWDVTPPVVSLHGMPGVGKSTLALHTAHELRPLFPDGQLYVDLRDRHGRPLPSAGAVDGFLHRIGLQPDPKGRLEDRAEHFRAWSADRKVLVVLDNAVCAEQVLPLLPSGPGCATILTSRSPLDGLGEEIALELSLPSVEEGVQLLDSLLPAGQVAQDRQHAEEVVRLCGRLPAAICAAASQLGAKPQWGLHELAGWLADSTGRLSTLMSPDASLRNTLELICRTFGQSGQRIFERLGMLPETFTREELLGGGDDVDGALKHLVESRLVERVLRMEEGSYRPAYGCHELVRLYAQERRRAAEPRLEDTLPSGSYPGPAARSPKCFPAAQCRVPACR
ncbi:AfsR/SARP family transcriptional regulator [Streptomyces sp. NRRL B-3648]|uniref:AfsR/SARP family transcriptional regulator n=1 Tax=Streptomyces sp. NRRL B-3648 TaxID=1519493 RepID=UPI0006AF379A|nr:AfsR/SARP family transcriptional regulator [Streptomyces sp. NRRL B-3648]